MHDIILKYINTIDTNRDMTPEVIGMEVVNMVEKLHRNPEHKELQNIYAQDVKNVGDAFIFEKDKWTESSWDVVSALVLCHVNACCLTSSTMPGNTGKKEMIGKLIKFLTNYDPNYNTELTDQHRRTLKKIAFKLNFDSIMGGPTPMLLST